MIIFEAFGQRHRNQGERGVSPRRAVRQAGPVEGAAQLGNLRVGGDDGHRARPGAGLLAGGDQGSAE